MLANPGPRPRKHLSSVPVIDLLEPISSTSPQELRVRHPLTLASHTLYLTLPQKMCHEDRSRHKSFWRHRSQLGVRLNWRTEAGYKEVCTTAQCTVSRDYVKRGLSSPLVPRNR